MRTNIVIDDQLMTEALSLSSEQTKKAVVEESLRLFVQMKKQQKIRHLRGKITWEGDLSAMRNSRF